MRREQLFSRTGYYRYLLNVNVLLHREAAEASIDRVRSLLEGRHSGQPVRVLDLAFGQRRQRSAPSEVQVAADPQGGAPAVCGAHKRTRFCEYAPCHLFPISLFNIPAST